MLEDIMIINLCSNICIDNAVLSNNNNKMKEKLVDLCEASYHSRATVVDGLEDGIDLNLICHLLTYSMSFIFIYHKIAYFEIESWVVKWNPYDLARHWIHMECELQSMCPNLLYNLMFGSHVCAKIVGSSWWKRA